MEIKKITINDLDTLKAIYLEAFPSNERKPFFNLKKAIKNGKAIAYGAKENDELCGFIITYTFKNLVLVDYLAVSSKIRSKGTGSLLIQDVIKNYQDKIIVLLIEKIDENATNYKMRISRKKFYLKNGFTSTNLFINSKGGNMEIMNYGGMVDSSDFMNLMEHALGKLYFRLSKMEFVK